MVTRRDLKIREFFKFCDSFASMSTCRRASTGAIIFPMDLTAIYAIGYNGQPRLCDNDDCTGIEGDCGCIHAEANAILKLDYSTTKDCIMYCTTAPCMQCAGLILNCAPIKILIFDKPYRDPRGIRRIENSGLSVYTREVMFDD